MANEKRLETAGTYQVSILQEPKWFLKPAKDGDEARMELVLRGEVNGGEHDAEYVDARLDFTRVIIKSGVNQGRIMFEVSAEKCIELGMSEPFDPTKTGEIVGATCEFVCEWEEYRGKNYFKVRYINSQSRPALAPDKAAEIWRELQAGSSYGAEIGATLPEGDSLGLGIDSADDFPFGK